MYWPLSSSPFALGIQIDIFKHKSSEIRSWPSPPPRTFDISGLLHAVDDHIVHHGIQPCLCWYCPASSSDIRRNILLRQDTAPDGIVHIVVDIGNLIGKPYHLPFQRVGACPQSDDSGYRPAPPRSGSGPLPAFSNALHHPQALLLM